MCRDRAVKIKMSSATAWTGSMTSRLFVSLTANCSKLLWQQLQKSCSVHSPHSVDTLECGHRMWTRVTKPERAFRRELVTRRTRKRRSRDPRRVDANMVWRNVIETKTEVASTFPQWVMVRVQVLSAFYVHTLWCRLSVECELYCMGLYYR